MTEKRFEVEKNENILKKMGFGWSSLLSLCSDCIHFEDLNGKVTYVGRPPAPICKKGHCCMRGKDCKDYFTGSDVHEFDI